ncbi:predicted protein [Botrytis cinerea T4]|uniref:Uncharacterized protein n=1 Tax=Botryotinia fuckeliana (strain T4) TaxID=999810 RepID=G2YY00_BOTF4|nr:predicted protein [Botrytis cinerea T4]
MFSVSVLTTSDGSCEKRSSVAIAPVCALGHYLSSIFA